MSNITESWQEREQKCPFLQNDTDYCHCEREANRNYNEVPSSPVRTELWKCEEQLGRQLVRLRTAGGGRGLTRGAGLVPLTQQPRRPLPGHHPPHHPAGRGPASPCSLPGVRIQLPSETYFSLASVGLRWTASDRSGCPRAGLGLGRGAGFSPGSTGHTGETPPSGLTALT